MTIEQIGKKFIARSTFAEREIPKAAGFRWNPTERVWWTSDQTIAAKLMDPEGAAKVLADKAAKDAEKAVSIEASRQAHTDIEIPCREGLAYLPYQCAGIAYAMARPATLFGDEMGLGKTIQAIGVINADPSIKKILIICPASLKLNWHRELRKWLMRDLQVGFANGYLPASDIVIINYDILAKHQASMRLVEWDLIIADEAHWMKNPKAKRTRAVCGIDDYTARKEECAVVEPLKARRKLFLTGTPIPNRPIEAFPLLHFLAPDEFRSWYGFAKRYCDGGSDGHGFDSSGASNLAELQDKMRATVMVRRLKMDVLKELPAKRRAIIEFADDAGGAVTAETDAWEAQQDRLQALRVAVELAKASDDPEDYADAVALLKVGTTAAFTELAKLRHDTAVAKIPYVVEHLKAVIEEGKKVIVFAHHHDVIEAIAAEFGRAAVTIYGPTPMAERQANVDRFQKDPTCRVIVGGFGPMGVGWTLTASSHVVFAELDWVPGNMTQAEDRAHRIGQSEMVLVQHLVLEGSLDARMASILVEKQEVQAAALDDATERTAPVVPSSERERAATESLTRAKVEAEAAKLSPDQVAAIHAALKVIAGMCDGAAKLDGHGFSKVDVAIGHSLADCWLLSPRQAVLGAKLVRKYRRQIPEGLFGQACV